MRISKSILFIKQEGFDQVRIYCKITDRNRLSNGSLIFLGWIISKQVKKEEGFRKDLTRTVYPYNRKK